MINKAIWGIALMSAIRGHVSNVDELKDLTPEAIIEEIENESDRVTIWEPFEHMDGAEIAENIENDATRRVNDMVEVADLIETHMVDIATQDLLDLDLNNLDLKGWVKTGFGNELEGDQFPCHTVGSSHGRLKLNVSGFVIESESEFDCDPSTAEDVPCNGNGCISRITWFDLREWATAWHEDWDSLQNGRHFDILDLGGETSDGVIFEADEHFRENVARARVSENGELEGHIPQRAVKECTMGGRNAEPFVDRWVKQLEFTVPEAVAIKYLKEFGSWDDLETCGIEVLTRRVFWVACSDISEHGEWLGAIH
jgi:hypothetical protein